MAYAGLLQAERVPDGERAQVDRVVLHNLVDESLVRDGVDERHLPRLLLHRRRGASVILTKRAVARAEAEDLLHPVPG